MAGILIIIAAVIGGLAIFSGEDKWVCSNGQWVKQGNPKTAMPTAPCGDNLIGGQKDEHGCLIPAGYKWCPSKNKCLRAWEEYCEEYKGEYRGNDKIKVNSPKPDDVISSPIEVSGEARGTWYFEASFPVKIEDEKGNVLGQGPAQAEGEWMTENFVPFKASIKFDPKDNERGYIVLEKDNPSGLPENAESIRIPVQFSSKEKTKVKLFFNNNKLDPEISCNKVFPVEREVDKTEAIGKKALELLLNGPADIEKRNGYSTSINPNVKINSLTVKDGVAKVDFNEEIEKGTGGSCRVSAIRAQISETLKQFPTIKSVIISVGGRTEDALQP